ncbi:toll/interleukin-1 receptor domain-containing protein [Carnobacterium inhibens]|uniref:toll/interleukin-1 receptor domain-containing protein n=1 Tax=Carnobacterium inhibens TaxID=147709 RepID=UPI002040680F|nr:toll/interleukin-1 receptor domain-containing protein [Carnobacterium inhibens]MCM3511718.1 toll/interleukin-1 receptor domain-containing protein [Carnobacterium inhibens]
MSAEQVQRTVNQLNKDIASLEKKMADLVKKEADKTKKIGATQKSITKNTSASTLRTKNRQIEGYQKDVSKILTDKADINKKIADKRKKLSDATLKLQKIETTQAKSLAKQQDKVFATYEKQILDLTKQVTEQSAITTSSENIFNSDGAEDFDVFLSHAAEDKESFCDEFSNILQETYGLKVWYDSISIKWGDSIRAEIDKGLKKSKFGVVILSRNYIKKYWTNYELEALFQIESNGGKIILPVWHDITKKEIQEFSPALAGKLAMNTGIMTPNEIAEKLNELFQSSQEE